MTSPGTVTRAAGFLRQYARTRRFSLGLPRDVVLFILLPGVTHITPAR